MRRTLAALARGLPAALLAAVCMAGEDAPATAPWRAWGATLELRLDRNLLEDLGLSIAVAGSGRPVVMPADPGAGLEFYARQGDFRGLAGGALHFRGALTLRFGGHELHLDGLKARPASKPLTFALGNRSGQVLFFADHMHHNFNPAKGRLDFNYMDLRISPWLAQQLGRPMAAGLSIGRLAIHTRFDTPPAAAKGVRACKNPRWAPGVDIATTHITEVQQTGEVKDGRVVITPAAYLMNVGLAEVPWIAAFQGPGGPYHNDQHPFLTWALYRIKDGVIRQLGYSAVKHAFNAVNIDCPCVSGQTGLDVLWSAGHPDNGKPCRDFYSVRTNTWNKFLGPRDEITAHLGTWNHCGSHFDGEPADCKRNHDGTEESGFVHGLVVEEVALEADGAKYLFEAWYLVRDDVNPDNNLAHVEIAPFKQHGVWFFSPGPTRRGPAIDAWVPAGTQGPDAWSQTLKTEAGRLRLAVQVESLPGDHYRYRYALMNFTLDRQVRAFSIPLPPGVSPEDAAFFDTDRKSANDWGVAVEPGRLRWRAGGDPPVNTLRWGTLFSFAFTSGAAPVETGARIVALESEANPVYFIKTLGPATDVLFADGFDG